jgi:hypothetical protein
MQQGLIVEGRSLPPPQVPWPARLVAKIVLDILPAALASVIGGILFAHAQFGHAPSPPLQRVEPASAEMMAMVRDEHAMIMDYLDNEIAAQRRRDAAADADTARAAADAKAAADAMLAASAAAQRGAAAPVAAKPAHAKVPVAAPPRAPLLIAQAQMDQYGATAPADSVASGGKNSLVARTLDIKDHVVAATRRAVSVIGDAFSSVGEHISSALPGPRQFSSAS